MSSSDEIVQGIARLRRVMDFATSKAEAHKPELFTHPSSGSQVRRAAAAALVRIPGLLKGIVTLAELGLFAEVESLARVLVDLAVTACWVGENESRGQRVWDDSIRQFKKGIERAKKHGVEPSTERQRDWEQEQRSSQGGKLPAITLRPEQTLDWSGFEAHALATHAYDLQFSLLSGAIHGDLRTARMVARGVAQAILPGDLAFAENAAVVLLMAVSLQLGFAAEFERWLDQFHPD